MARDTAGHEELAVRPQVRAVRGVAVFAWVLDPRLKRTCAWPGFRVQCDRGQACQEMKDMGLGRRQRRPQPGSHRLDMQWPSESRQTGDRT